MVTEPVPPRWRWPELLPSFGCRRCYRCRWRMNTNELPGYPTGGVRQYRIILRFMPGGDEWNIAALCVLCWWQSSVEEQIAAYNWLMRDCIERHPESKAAIAESVRKAKPGRGCR